MKFGYVVPGGTVPQILELAEQAEAAGWDGFFYYDAIDIGAGELHDPWVLLAGIAARTSRVRLGAIISPLARRRPWKVAREATTLDHLSGGRFVLAVGLGVTEDGGFAKVGEPVDKRVLAERLDESLEITCGLMSGEPFAYSGRHFNISEPMRFNPVPVQRPRIPIWVVAAWPHARSLARAFRYDGVLNQGPQTAEVAGSLRERAVREDFDVVMFGGSATPEPEQLAELAAAGATWWLAEDWGWEGDLELVRRRVMAGPPGR